MTGIRKCTLISSHLETEAYSGWDNLCNPPPYSEFSREKRRRKKVNSKLKKGKFFPNLILFLPLEKTFPLHTWFLNTKSTHFLAWQAIEGCREYLNPPRYLRSTEKLNIFSYCIRIPTTIVYMIPVSSGSGSIYHDYWDWHFGNKPLIRRHQRKNWIEIRP